LDYAEDSMLGVPSMHHASISCHSVCIEPHIVCVVQSWPAKGHSLVKVSAFWSWAAAGAH